MINGLKEVLCIKKKIWHPLITFIEGKGELKYTLSNLKSTHIKYITIWTDKMGLYMSGGRERGTNI